MPTAEELDARITELETMGRWADVAQALDQRAELGADATRIATLLRLMRLYLEKFANQVEAMRAAERILDIDPRHPDAVAFLRDAYAKRRLFDALAELEARLKDETQGPYR